GERRQHAIRLPDGPAEGDHGDDVAQADLLPRAADGAAFQCEARLVPLAVVTTGPPPAEHGVLFLRLEPATTDQPCILVGLEVAETHDHRPRIVSRRDAGHRASERIDKVLRFVGEALSELLDAAPRTALFH